MRTLLAILLASGGVATTWVVAPALRGTGAPTADLIVCPSASVQLPQTVGPVDGLIASAGVPTSASYGTCATGFFPFVPIVDKNLSELLPGIG